MPKRKRAPGQLPMGFMVPESSWVVPAELPDWRGRPLALDTETRDDGLSSGQGPGWAYRNRGYICGVSAAVDGAAFYAPVRHPDTANLDPIRVADWVRDHVRASPVVTFFNAHYDLGWLGTEWGINVDDAKVDDALAAAVLLDENRRPGQYNLDATCRWRGVPGKDEAMLRQAAEAYGVDPKADLWRLPADLVGPYAEADARATLELRANLQPDIEAQGLGGALRLENDLVNMVVAMRRRGVRVDTDRALEVRRTLRGRRDAALAQISTHMAIGRALDVRDINSPQFLTQAFDAAKVAYPRTPPTKGHPTGQPSFSKDWMAGHEHWLPRGVAEVTKYDDAAEKFLTLFILGYASHGRLHAEVHQYLSDSGGTKSYRFSYSDPPLQQMPSRDGELAALIRGCFLPEDGGVWGSHDYSQQEYRLIVHFASVCGMVGAEKAVQAYRDDPKTDFHDMVVRMTGLERKPAKDTNFAKAFGAGVPKFAAMIGKSIEEAGAIYEQYDREMPFVSRLGEFCAARAASRGYLRLIDGARSHFDDWEPRWVKKEEYARGLAEHRRMDPCPRPEALARVADPTHPWHHCQLRRSQTHKAMNRLIQGSAARQTKMAMRACWREGLLPLLQLHDELDFSHERKEQGDQVNEIMRDVVPLVVPVAVDAEYGVSWGHSMRPKDGSYGVGWEDAVRALHEQG